MEFITDLDIDNYVKLLNTIYYKITAYSNSVKEYLIFLLFMEEEQTLVELIEQAKNWDLMNPNDKISLDKKFRNNFSYNILLLNPQTNQLVRTYNQSCNLENYGKIFVKYSNIKSFKSKFTCGCNQIIQSIDIYNFYCGKIKESICKNCYSLYKFEDISTYNDFPINIIEQSFSQLEFIYMYAKNIKNNINLLNNYNWVNDYTKFIKLSKSCNCFYPHNINLFLWHIHMRKHTYLSDMQKNLGFIPKLSKNYYNDINYVIFCVEWIYKYNYLYENKLINLSVYPINDCLSFKNKYKLRKAIKFYKKIVR